jgi:hypothetical protein
VDRPAPPPSAEGVYNKRVRKGPVKRVAKRGHGASAPRGANPLHKSSEPAGKTRWAWATRRKMRPKQRCRELRKGVESSQTKWTINRERVIVIDDRGPELL